VYITRDKAIGRRVSNEDELMEMLSEYGFKKYHLEDRTVVENVRLFSNANLVVSPHGAGLTDIMFCDDCTVIEMFGSRENDAYEQLSRHVGLDYIGIDCESDATDITADIDRIEKIVRRKDERFNN
jgi:capsular polysaccharide biosynthesis protein